LCVTATHYTQTDHTDANHTSSCHLIFPSPDVSGAMDP
jgi:hypothetical protein